MSAKPGNDDVPSARPMSKDDKALRDQQLQFYAGDVKKLNALLDGFLKKSNAKVAMLITQGGHMITKVGKSEKMDTDTVAALVSGAFAATKLLFKSFNEDGFALTVQTGKKESIYIGVVGGRSLLTINFDDTTTQGAVQLYAAETTKKLEELYAAIDRGEGSAPGEDEKMDENFGASASGNLDNVFG